MNQKIVITGAAGLVGQNLIVMLRQQGYTNIVALDKSEPNLALLRRLHPQIVAELADLAEDGPWQAHFAGAACAMVLHAQIGHPTEEPFQRNNIVATDRVLQALKTHSVPHVVHISSSVVNSAARDFYTETKRTQEKMMIDSGLPVVVLRPTLMFGWFDRKHLGWLSRFLKRVPVFPIPGHGRYMRQPLYVGDFCRIIIACMERKIIGQTFNISGVERIDYIDIIRSMKRAMGVNTLILKIPTGLFAMLLQIWALFDRNPPFTVSQLKALVTPDEFEVIDWPGIFGTPATPFAAAIERTLCDPTYSQVVLEF
jgi:nucleoside-diphosphate-sugar epimerase